MNAIEVAKPVAQMAPADLEKFCASAPKEAAAAIQNLIRCNTAAFPDMVFVRRGPEGMVQKVRTQMVLTEARKEVLRLKKKKSHRGQDGQYSDIDVWSNDITAAGYRALNQTAGLHVITPECVVVGDKRQPNPYIIEDERSHTPQRVYARKVVIGPARDTGNLVATDIMCILDLRLYFLETLMAKLDSKYTTSAETLGQHGLATDPTTKPTAPAGSIWTFYPVVGDAGIWFNIKHPAYQAALKDHVQRCKFADRIAQTVAERNAMKAHPGMPSASSEIAPGVVGVNVVGWTANFSHSQLERLREMVNSGGIEGGELGGQRVEVVRDQVTEVDDADRDDVERVAAEESQVDREPGAEESAPQTSEPALTPKPGKAPVDEKAPAQAPAAAAERKQLIADATQSYNDLVQAIGAKQAKEKLVALGIKGLASATDEQLNKLIDEIPF